MSMFSVYIIESLKDSSWYYGFTADVKARLNYHNQGLSHYTKTKLPWKLIFKRDFVLKTEALKFERYLKKTRNKDYITKTYFEFFF